MKKRGPGRGRLVRTKDAEGAASYVGDWTDSQGRRHRKSLSSDRRVADRMLAAIVRDRDLARLGLGHESSQEKPLAEVVAAYLLELRATRSAAHLDRTERDLTAATAFLGATLRIRDIDPARVMEWRRARMLPPLLKRGEKLRGRKKEGAGVRTANMGASALRSCLEWARRSGMIAANPLRDLRPMPSPESSWKKRRRALSEAEIGRFLAAVHALDLERADRRRAHGKTRWYTPRDGLPPVPQAPFYRAVVACGFRFGEAAAATWRDFDEAERVIVLRAETTKARRTREVPIPVEIVADLAAVRAAQALTLGRPANGDDPIFAGPKGGKLDASNARKVLVEALRRAKIAEKDERGRSIDIHALRATATTRMLRRGVPLPVVMEIVGSKSAAVTLRHYTDLRVHDTRAAIDGVPVPCADAPQPLRAAVGTSEVGSNLAMAPDSAPMTTTSGTAETPMNEGEATIGPCRTRTCNLRIMSRFSAADVVDDATGQPKPKPQEDRDFDVEPSPW